MDPNLPNKNTLRRPLSVPGRFLILSFLTFLLAALDARLAVSSFAHEPRKPKYIVMLPLLALVQGYFCQPDVALGQQASCFLPALAGSRYFEVLGTAFCGCVSGAKGGGPFLRLSASVLEHDQTFG